MEFRLRLRDSEQQKGRGVRSPVLAGVIVLLLLGCAAVLVGGLLLWLVPGLIFPMALLLARAGTLFLLLVTFFGLLLLMALRALLPSRRQGRGEMVISEAGVRSSNPEFRYSWPELQKVILQGNVLTILSKSGTLSQNAVEQPGFESEELEAFVYACQRLAEDRS